MRNQPIEVLCYDISNKSENSITLPTTPTPIRGKEYLLKYPQCLYRGCVWLYTLRKDFIIRHNLSFIPNILHEDMVFTAEIFLYTRSILFTAMELYYYRLREGSIMNSKPTKERMLQSMHSCLIIAKKFIAFAEQEKDPLLKKIFYRQVYTYYTFSVVRMRFIPRLLYQNHKNFAPLFPYLAPKERFKASIYPFYHFFRSIAYKLKS
ncbi:glycosyltransferase family protein [Helicobacter mustelae]|uniref:hypothetical protein n=1 Tax=Helicobacter mustelae TaxID=217 RepID=UPI0002E03824|nr:hypothetical protein [Helicobacter mustelae]SQH71298.1 LPS biosynthesis-related glycosyltransferase [Helicobacter mustelae]